MKIEVIKPQEEVKWTFPCKGSSKIDNTVVGFSRYGQGVILDIGLSNYYRLYDMYNDWDMNNFIPLEEKEKGNNYDWSNPDFPILAKITDEEVFMIDRFEVGDNSVSVTTFNISHNYVCEEREKFSSEEERNEWLKSLEILPKGTEIKITF